MIYIYIYIYMQHMHISYNMSSDMFAKHLLLGVIRLLMLEFSLRLQEAGETLLFFFTGVKLVPYAYTNTGSLLNMSCMVWYGKVTAMQCSVMEYIWSHIVLYGNIGDCTVLYRYVWTCVGRCPHRHVWVCMGISACALCICSFMHVFIYLFIEVLMHLCIYVFRYICKSQCVHVSTYLNVYVDVS